MRSFSELLPQHRAIFYILFAAFNFSLMGVFVKLSSQNFTSIEVSFYRFFVTFLILVFISRGRLREFKSCNLLAHFYRSLSGAIAIFGYFYAISVLHLGTAVILNYTSPIWMIVIGSLIFRENISKVNVIGVFISFVGILLIFQPEVERDQVLPTFIGLSSGMFAAMAYFGVRKLGQLGESSKVVVFYFSAFSTLMTFVVMVVDYLVYGRGFNFPNLLSGSYVFGVGFFSFVAQIYLTKALILGNTFQVSALSYLNPVLAWIFGVSFLGDIFDFLSFSGIILIILSGVLVAFYGSRRIERR